MVHYFYAVGLTRLKDHIIVLVINKLMGYFGYLKQEFKYLSLHLQNY
jgi:hypothetical protein